MFGYKVYFDGNKFTMEDHKSQVGNTYNDDTTHWNAEYHTAVEAVKNLNNCFKSDINELKNDNDFIVPICKDCNRHFIMTKSYIDWFNKRKLNIPSRCDLCRKRRDIRRNIKK